MRRAVLLIFLSLIISSCTVGRWTVAEEQVIDTNSDPVELEQIDVMNVESYPTVDRPIITFTAQQIVTRQYTKRVQVERTVQKYRPRWGFLITALGGALFSAIAANSSQVISSPSPSQRIALNATAGVLAALAITNLEPDGEPIRTGESQLMRSTGVEIVQDTLSVDNINTEQTATVRVHYDQNVIFEQADIVPSQNRIEINLGAIANELPDDIQGDSELTINVEYAEFNTSVPVSIDDFLSRFITINSPITSLRSSPQTNENNILAEVGEGSQLELLEEHSENWFRVRYREVDVYVEKEAGQMKWLSTVESGPAVLVEFANIPFGEIDVESRVPVLKTQNPDDRALVITNGLNNYLGSRQYLARDHQLFRFYMQSALRIPQNNIEEIESTVPDDWISQLNELPYMNQSGALFIYLTGFATVEENGSVRDILLTYEDQDGETSNISLASVFELLKQTEPEKLFLFVDLDYMQQEQNGVSRNEERLLLDRIAGQFVEDLPNSVLIFSSLPGQQSNLYTGSSDENMRHHIFNYFLAEAIQQRKTSIDDLIRHLENNVDYTARRLHDRSQEIRVYGNRELNLAD